MVTKSKLITEEDMTITVMLPLSKIQMYNELVIIQSGALWLLSEAEKKRRAYPAGKKWGENYDQVLAHVNGVNQSLARIQAEIRECMRAQIKESLWSFLPPF